MMCNQVDNSHWYVFFFFKQKTAYDIMPSLVGSEMCIRDRSILDMIRIGARPDFGAVAPLDAAELMDLFGTVKPSRADVEANEELFEQMERVKAYTSSSTRRTSRRKSISPAIPMTEAE